MKKLLEIGVDSLKIEGRMKKPEYVYLVTRIYRKAIDSYFETGKVIIDEKEVEDLKKSLIDNSLEVLFLMKKMKTL